MQKMWCPFLLIYVYLPSFINLYYESGHTFVRSPNMPHCMKKENVWPSWMIQEISGEKHYILVFGIGDVGNEVTS
jgi:hypothetical protein